MTSSFINHLGLSTNPKSFDEVDVSAVNKMKIKLESYNTELLFLYKQLNWKKIEDSYAILLCTIVLYLIVWKLDIPLLCLFFLLLQGLVLFDYFHIKISSSSKSKKDGGSNHKEFDELCRSLVATQKYIQETLHCYSLLKRENPFWMCALTSAILIFLALLSKILGDLLFSFLVINLALYYPGLKANGYVDQASVYVFTNVANVLRAFQGKDKSA
ncbi:hypothetical protein M8J76_002923 [Diaphorina citri]|nr:hypothetical protein M8J76_002923 [Diaphorina citri]